MEPPGSGRTLTGAWIETCTEDQLNKAIAVAPSRVRGLKQKMKDLETKGISRTLTGAWIETTLHT